ncbi:hypothetical protein EDC01DRAFT_104985 [Geopyxis carbonaria]|nr:hypothetical protein EDC01DRAFT_104985 [Geopyxis carbonaria]
MLHRFLHGELVAWESTVAAVAVRFRMAGPCSPAQHDRSTPAASPRLGAQRASSARTPPGVPSPYPRCRLPLPIPIATTTSERRHHNHHILHPPPSTSPTHRAPPFRFRPTCIVCMSSIVRCCCCCCCCRFGSAQSLIRHVSPYSPSLSSPSPLPHPTTPKTLYIEQTQSAGTVCICRYKTCRINMDPSASPRYDTISLFLWYRARQGLGST